MRVAVHDGLVCVVDDSLFVVVLCTKESGEVHKSGTHAVHSSGRYLTDLQGLVLQPGARLTGC